MSTTTEIPTVQDTIDTLCDVIEIDFCCHAPPSCIDVNFAEIAEAIHDEYEEAIEDYEALAVADIKGCAQIILDLTAAGDCLMNGNVTFDTLRWRRVRDASLVQVLEMLS
jgi:hypothetical protein